MTLEAGTRLGVYEVTGLLGVGGMGEVYRATDTKLGRKVAIKTLPAELASNKDRLARFEREAKLLAALNHPHIASVYSLDEHEGTLYLAMELVEGETLERKLASGRLPIDEALRIALQIAEALEAAHEKGVVHRDLKPANIMVSGEGQVKVLDFGLAKAFATDPKQTVLGHSPALSLAMTQQGLVLGTAGYMSPEQASGQGTDQRADIWAFGVVLYELLTGKPVFTGESVPHILADVLKTEPDWSRLPKDLHPRLRLLLERCLEKRARDRCHSIADARVDIERVLSSPHGIAATAAAERLGATRGSRRRSLAIAGIAAVAGAAVAGLVGWLVQPAPTPRPVLRVSIPLPEDQQVTSFSSMIAVSPDGTRIAYAANNQIYLRNLDEAEARPVPGTAEAGVGATDPAFSPDGRWLAYLAVAGFAGPYVVKRVPVSGGTPARIHEAEGLANLPLGLTWPTPDTILFADAEGIVRVPASGGAAEVLVPRREDDRFYSPQLLPGGKAVLFTRLPGTPGPFDVDFDAAQVLVQSIGGNDRKVVWEGGSGARYLPDGRLVYAQGATLFAIPFDSSTHAVHGGPVPMVEGLRGTPGSPATNIAIGDSGVLAFVPGNGNAAAAGATPKRTLVWVDRNGREEPLPMRPDSYLSVRISPDGTRVSLVVGAVVGRSTGTAIWIFDLRTQNLSLLTGDPKGDDGPVWSSDSRRIFFRSFRDPGIGVYSIEPETGETKLVALGNPETPAPLPWSISSDDRTLAVIDFGGNWNADTLAVADGVFTRLLSATASDIQPSISRDGAWMAYALGSGSEQEIDVRPLPDAARTRIPIGPGSQPVFSRDGSELFFFNGKGLAAAPVTYQPTLRVGPPQQLFESTAYLYAARGRAWDVDPSGKRFLMIRMPDSPAVSAAPARQRIDVVVNWFEELKRKVPTTQ
jgi:serine/threonine-protein kinase